MSDKAAVYIPQRKRRGPYFKFSLGREIAADILTAIEQERTKRGLSTRELSRRAGCNEQSYKSTIARGGGNLVTIAAYCAALDIEIVLVDRDGTALT